MWEGLRKAIAEEFDRLEGVPDCRDGYHALTDYTDPSRPVDRAALKLYQRKYRTSAKGKKAAARSQRNYRMSEKGKAAMARDNSKRKDGQR